MGLSSETTESSPKSPIPSTPTLRFIDRLRRILTHSNTNPNTDESQTWLNLAEQVEPYTSLTQLDTNIRDVVVGYTKDRIPELKRGVHSFRNLDDDSLINAIANNWFEDVTESIGGQRREVLLAVATHIVKRIETHTYKDLLTQASNEQLHALGLNPELRELVVNLLDISTKADPLFIRFLALSQLSQAPPPQATPHSFYIDNNLTPYTLAQLFPKETTAIARRIVELSKTPSAWQNLPNGKQFAKYLETVSRLLSTQDPTQAEILQSQAEQEFVTLLQSDFPVIFTFSTEGYYNEPYYDPELRISLRSPQTREQDAQLDSLRMGMLSHLDLIHEEEYRQSLEQTVARSAISIGAYGVNTVFNAAAQEKPAIVFYANEQSRQLDSEYPQYVRMFTNYPQAFGEIDIALQKSLLIDLSRNVTAVHEFSHYIYPDDDFNSQRLGRKPLTKIDEIKADIIGRPLIPSLIQDNVLQGNPKQWAIALTAGSLQFLNQESGDEQSPYFLAAAYNLNDLFSSGVVVINSNNTFTITNYEQFYEIQAKNAQEVLDLYRDKTMNEDRAASWIQKRCRPNKLVQKALSAIRTNLTTTKP